MSHHRALVKQAINDVRNLNVKKKQSEGVLTALVDGQPFEGAVTKVSYPGTNVYIAIMVIEGYDHIIDFAIDEDVLDGKHLVQLYDDGGKVTAGYSVEKEGEPSLNYVAELGGANILHEDGKFSGSFIVKLEPNDRHRTITEATFKPAK
ncbi:hypothetical protein HU751_015125 [Pseudomonas sp. BW13M1]|uniref:Uncharacterized protein n=1 Tax=Pseudomonas peradeniyensis TaxID=2745488 RepID=A0A923G5K2_9PSED|nr:hypothetical protein [Pseudomonas peradeniyensis]MBV4506177.1 hypothetical protein [Pseudomonas peradeniyensis]